MSAEHVSLIFDIGKTTKKALVFNPSYDVLDEQNENFKEIKDDDGFPADDFDAISRWVKDIFNQYTRNSKYVVKYVNVSAYGASLVHLDSADKVIKPFYNYLKPLPQSTIGEFWSAYNQDKSLIKSTASPFLGMLNSGLQLFWLSREKKELFSRIKTTLHFPQYFTFLLTGQKFSEITSIGCHTMLWDYGLNNYHDWVKREKLDLLFPRVCHSNETFNYDYNGQVIRVGVGVHDSSSALMPYLATAEKPFLLLSTGTWNICFNPFNPDPLTDAELEKDCLSYLTYRGKPVKASRIFLGHEHEVQQMALASYFNVDSNFYKGISFNEQLYKKLINENDGEKNFYPLDMTGTGPLPEKFLEKTDYSAFQNFEEAQHKLIITLAQWQKISIDLVDPAHEIPDIIIVGGFTKSPLFLEILKRELKGRRILTSDHPRAAALGGAWLVTGDYDKEHCKNLLKVSAF